MTRIEEILEELNAIDEHIKIEAKQCTNKVDKSVLETICAFSNEPGLGGGEILLGLIDTPEHEMRYRIGGLTDPDKIQKDLASQCATMFNHPIRPIITTETIDGKTLLLISIKELNPLQKPLYFKNEKLPQGAWRRIGSTDQRCSDEDLRILHGNADGFDKLMLEETDLDDIDENAVARYRRLRAEVNSQAEELALSDIEMLRALKAIKKDKSGDWHLTTTGLLVFGKQLSLRREMPSVRVDYIRVPGNEWVPDARERFESIDMRGPLLLMVGRAYNAIVDDLPRGFSLQPGQLQANRSIAIPEDALREAIVNALIHQSFNIHRPIQIIRYHNRIEIINPGCSLKPDESLGEPGSEMRNPNIGAIFHDTNLAEAKGTGIGAMRRLMKGAGLMAPTFGSDHVQHTFTIRLLLHHLLGEEDIKWLSQPEFAELNTEHKTALVFMREVGAIDNITYRQLNGCSARQASADLKKLQSLDLIYPKGNNRSTYYIPSQRLFELKHTTFDANSVCSDANTVCLDAKVACLDPKVACLDNITCNLSLDLQERLSSLGKKCSKQLFEQLVVDLCGSMPLNIEQLSQITNRNQIYLRNKIIPKLMREKRLFFTIPEMVKHPNQKYTARKS